jgi:hypothetical protein
MRAVMFHLTVACLLFPAARAAAQCSEQALAALASVQEGSGFGTAVALQGDELFVGAAGAIFGLPNPDGGHVDRFVRAGGGWTWAESLVSSDVELGDHLGCSLAVQGDRLVVGAQLADFGDGAAYVFERVAGAWQQVAKLSATSPNRETFGHAVALDGERIVVGAFLESAAGVTGAGAAYIFDHGPGGWTQVARLQPADLLAFDGFGWSCAVQGDTVVVGKPGDNDAFGPGGSTYVFERAPDGTWPLVQTLQGDHPAGDFFGMNVLLEGDTLAVSAHLESVPSEGDFAGAVYLFDQQPGGFVRTQRIAADDPLDAEFFGGALAFDGDHLAVGSGLVHASIPLSPGAVSVYSLTEGAWARSWALAPPATLQDAASFGGSLALEQATLVVGANTEQVPGAGAGETIAYELGALHAPYGAGLGGTGGWVPELHGSTCTGGSTAVHLQLRIGLGLAPAVLLIGPAPVRLPAAGGIVQVAPPWRLFGLQLGGPAVAGAGSLDLHCTLPATTDLPPIFAQLLVLDAGAPFGCAISRGLAMPPVP